MASSQRRHQSETLIESHFLECTLSVMEVFVPGSDNSINHPGHWEEHAVNLKAAVKDRACSQKSWTYFSFAQTNGKRSVSAKAFPRTVY